MRITDQLKNKKNFSAAEGTLADYILENRQAALSMTVHELAEKSFTSSSCVVRLCHRMGLSGFREFRTRFAAENEQDRQSVSGIDPNYPFNDTDTIPDLSAKLSSLLGDSIHEASLLCASQADGFETAVRILRTSKQIAFFGIGDAYLSGQFFATRMMRIGTHMISTSVQEEQMHLAQTLREGDAALLLSYTGTTRTIARLTEILHQNHVRIISVTGAPDSPLGQQSDVCLQIPAKERKFYRFANFASVACMEYCLNILFSRYLLTMIRETGPIRID